MEVRDTLPYSTAAPQSSVALSESKRLPARLLAAVDSNRRWIFLAILGLYLIGFNGQWRVERDSALYLTIGRNLAEGQGYTYHGQPHHLAFPGLPLLFAGIFRLFHGDNLFPALVMMLGMGLATLGLTYRLFLLHAGRPTAVMMTFGLAITRVFYRYCFELLSDLPFLLGVMAFLAGYEAIFFRRKTDQKRACWYDWLLLAGGISIAIAMRPTMWVLLAAVVLAGLWSFARGIFRGSVKWEHLALGLALIAGVAAFFRFVDLRRGGARVPQYEEYFLNIRLSHPADVIHDMVHQSIPELCDGTLTKALFGCSIRYFNLVAALLVAALCVWLLRFRVLWGLWALMTLGMLLAFKPLDRYMLPVVPLLVFAWWRFLVWVNARLPEKWADLAFLAMLIFGACTNLARAGEMIVEQRRTPFLAHYHEGRYVSLKEVGRLVRDRVPRRGWVLVEPKVARIMTYVSHRNAIEPMYIEPGVAPKLEAREGDLFALLGPSWEDSKPRETGTPIPQEIILPWLAQHGKHIGPQLGPGIRHDPEKEPWRLYKVQGAEGSGFGAEGSGFGVQGSGRK